MIATLFYYGDFTGGDVDMAGLSLMAYAVGLPGFMLVKVLAPAFFSRKDTKTPVRIAVIALITNMTLNLVFVVPMVMLEIPGPHAGLALATSIAAWVNATLLFVVLYRKEIYRPRSGWRKLFLQMGLAGAALGALLLLGMQPVQEWLNWTAWYRVAGLSGWVVAGAAIYFVTLRLLGLHLKPLWKRVG